MNSKKMHNLFAYSDNSTLFCLRHFRLIINDSSVNHINKL